MLQMDLLREETLHALRIWGWTPGRRIDPTPMLTVLAEWGWAADLPLARAILSAFGGLRYNASTLQREEHRLSDGRWVVLGSMSYSIVPLEAPYIDTDLVDQWKHHPLVTRDNLRLCPIGENHRGATLFIASNGLVLRGKCYGYHVDDYYPTSLNIVAPSFEEALNTEASYNNLRYL